MRNRAKQREVRRQFGKEEPLDRKNAYGISDPTPYKAVKHIIKKDS